MMHGVTATASIFLALSGGSKGNSSSSSSSSKHVGGKPSQQQQQQQQQQQRKAFPPLRGGRTSGLTLPGLLILFGMVIILGVFGFLNSAMHLPEFHHRITNGNMGTSFNPAVSGTAAAAAAIPPVAAAVETPKEFVVTTEDNNNADKRQRGLAGETDARASAAAAGFLEIDGIRVPLSKWPVTLRDEDPENQETLLHPGNNQTLMKVPPFWSPPIHNGTLMSRKLAMAVGTCAKPDPGTGSFQRGDLCPLTERTIFIGIASYRDFQCRDTVESAFTMAQYPHRIRIGVVDQILKDKDVKCNQPKLPCTEDPQQALCKYHNQVDIYQMDAELSIGPVFARHMGHRLYRGEYYASQSDAHVSFTKGWDVDIIHQHESTLNEMAVLSTYLTDVHGALDQDGHSKLKTRPIMCNTVWEGNHLRHAAQPEKRPSVHGQPQLSPWWAAGYSFSRGHFLVNVPYDPYQPMVFQGEEMSIGIRGYTCGYDYYAPERSVNFHHYATGQKDDPRFQVPTYWENTRLYRGVLGRAMQRLLGIVKMNPEMDPESNWDHRDEATYGLGGARTTEQFYHVFGIDVVKKTIHNLCPFVDGPETGGVMHKMFSPYLRKEDGMGIDYSKIIIENTNFSYNGDVEALKAWLKKTQINK